MTFKGTIQNGKVVLDEPIALPNGTPVRVEPAPARTRRSGAKKPTKSDPAYDLGRFAVRTGIRDLAAEHDHYIYGTPKRSSRKTAKKASPRKRA